LKIDGLGDQLWGRRYSHREAKSFKTLHGASFNGFSVPLIKVVMAENLIILTASDAIVAADNGLMNGLFGTSKAGS